MSPLPPESFRAQAEALGSWLLSNRGQVPSAKSADTSEREVARWRKGQHNRLRLGVLAPEHEEYLDLVAHGWRRTKGGPEMFRARAEDLGRWLRSSGRVPSPRSADGHEKVLGSWREAQLVRLRAGALSPERAKCLDEVAAGWRSTPRTGSGVFQAQADELGRWLRSGRLPSRDSTDRRERSLASWRYVRLRQLRNGTLPPEREKYLDDVAPGWRPTPGSETFRSRAEDLGRWFASTDGVVPSIRSDDPRERWLTSWRQRQFVALRDGKLSLEHQRYLDQVAPGWRPRKRPPKTFPAWARALGRWMVWSDGKLPSHRSKDLYERRLHWWRATVLARLRTGTLSSDHEKYLNKVAPGWRRRAKSGLDEFPGQAQALGRWFASTDGRLPSSRSDDLHERRMCRWRAGWLFHLRNGTLSPERERYLDEVAPGWRPRHRRQDGGDS